MKTTAFRLPAARTFALVAVLGGATALALLLPPTARAQTLVVDENNGTSPYTLTGGTATYDNVIVGNTGVGLLVQTGGTLDIPNGPGNLDVGDESGSSGTYNLSGGTINANANSTIVGDHGTGVFTLSGDGVDEAGDSLIIGANGGNGTFNLDGGTLTTLGGVTNSRGTSTFNFNGGTLEAQPYYIAGYGPYFFHNLTNAYVLAGGARINTNGCDLTVAQNLTSGTGPSTADGGLTKLGGGTLTLSGNSAYSGPTTISVGTLAITGSLNNRPNGYSSSSGVWTVDGGSASNAAANVVVSGTLSTYTTYVGYHGAGTFTQNGGTFADDNSILYLGYNSGSNGSYTLSAGSLSTGQLVVGYLGTGTFTQTGGTLQAPIDFQVSKVRGNGSCEACKKLRSLV